MILPYLENSPLYSSINVVMPIQAPANTTGPDVLGRICSVRPINSRSETLLR